MASGEANFVRGYGISRPRHGGGRFLLCRINYLRSETLDELVALAQTIYPRVVVGKTRAQILVIMRRHGFRVVPVTLTEAC